MLQSSILNDKMKESFTVKAVNGIYKMQIVSSLGQKKLNIPHSMTSLVPDEGKLVHLDLQKLFYSTLPLALAINR